jgi:hypothetical protein
MDELELLPIQKQVADLIPTGVGHGKYCAMSAISHLKKAWRIRDLDPEMAAFRVLTAEEESVTAIFHALKRRKYRGAEELKHRNHVHKAAVYPFFGAVAKALIPADTLGLKTEVLYDDTESTPRLRVRVAIPTPQGKTLWAYPEPPLLFSMAVNGFKHDFANEIDNLTSDLNVKKILDHISERANRRNLLLYASDKGIPCVNVSIEPFILKQRDIVFANLMVYMLIEPYAEHQDFVQQCLNAFLKMLNLLPPDALGQEIGERGDLTNRIKSVLGSHPFFKGLKAILLKIPEFIAQKLI